jgi:hypothetical protein
MNRRQEQRLAVRRLCLVSPDSEGAKAIVGVTGNVSRSGMLVHFPGLTFPAALKQPGNSVRIVMDLPRNSRFPARFLEQLARVVRVSGDFAGLPTVAFEVYRVRVCSHDGETAQRHVGLASAYLQ